MAVCTLFHEITSKCVRPVQCPASSANSREQTQTVKELALGQLALLFGRGLRPPTRGLTHILWGGGTLCPGRPAAPLGHSFPPCLAGFAVAQCINQHSSSSLSSPSPSASGSPSGSGSTSHCDSGGASSSSTPSAAQSPAGIGRGTRCGGRDLRKRCDPFT